MEFSKITFENFGVCIKLSAGENSEKFVGPNVNSIALAYVALENNACTPMPFGIYKDEVLVGFMIDEKYQDKGSGKEALLKAIDYIKTKPKGLGGSCFLSYAPGNEKAEALYKKVGFVATGVVDDGEIQMKLSI